MQTVGIIGAGQMGCGIAEVCVASGLEVILSDVSADSLERGLEKIHAGIERQVSKGKISSTDAKSASAHLWDWHWVPLILMSRRVVDSSAGYAVRNLVSLNLLLP